MRARLLTAPLAMVLLWLSATTSLVAQQRFPPPDFESGYKLPGTLTPAPRSLWLEYVDVGVLILALGLACYFIYQRRSRRTVASLSLVSLGYFGFFRKGCICAIGSVQNVTLALADSSYALPLTALAFFVLPVVMSLFAGRSFCAAVCPHGALQDLILLKPISVPPWLEKSLGLLPFFYLGGAVALAAAGSAFLICRFDPFVPIFRLSGSAPLVLSGIALLGLGLFVGRPYCRFLCPYGALLKLAAKVSKWRVRITPDVCTQCRLCEQSCPFGVIEKPIASPLTAQTVGDDRRRLGSVLLLTPILICVGAWLGFHLGVPASTLDPRVKLAERYLAEQNKPVPLGVQTAAALSLNRAARDPQAILETAVLVRQRFRWAGAAFGSWVGLVIGANLISLSLHRRRTEFEPDRGGCFACARCFAFCPNERVRQGLLPVAAAVESGEEKPLVEVGGLR